MKKDIKQQLAARFSIQEWTPKLITCLQGYTREKFFKDVMAGLIVGIVALPLAMAFGISSGVTPEKGLITAIFAGFIVSALGGCSVQVAGPTGTFILVVSNAVGKFGIEGLLVVTVMAGIILIMMGVLKLGVVIRFIPYPIIVGFMSGIAVVILSTQVKDFLGLQITEPIPADFLSKWVVYLRYITTTNLVTLAVGLASLFIIIFSSKISKKIPGSLLAVVLVTVVVYLLRHYCDISSVTTIGDLHSIEGVMPKFNFDVNINIGMINELFPIAFTIAMMGAIESLISASVADGITGDKHNSDLELVVQGVANVFTGFIGGIPATGALARTVTNVSNGGRTPVAGLVHALFLLIVVVFLSGLIKHIPMACLAAILIIVAYNMSEWRTFVRLLKNSKADIVVLLVTFFLTLIFDLTIAIEVGLILAVFLFLKRMNEVSSVSVTRDVLNVTEVDASGDNMVFELPKWVEIYEIDGPFFFGLANKFEESMRIIGDKSKVRIIRMRKVPFIDSTGLQNLRSLCEKSFNDGIHVILSGVRPEVNKMIVRSDIPAMIGSENVCPHIHAAISRANVILLEMAAAEQKEAAEEK